MGPREEPVGCWGTGAATTIVQVVAGRPPQRARIQLPSHSFLSGSYANVSGVRSPGGWLCWATALGPYTVAWHPKVSLSDTRAQLEVSQNQAFVQPHHAHDLLHCNIRIRRRWNPRLPRHGRRARRLGGQAEVWTYQASLVGNPDGESVGHVLRATQIHMDGRMAHEM